MYVFYVTVYLCVYVCMYVQAFGAPFIVFEVDGEQEVFFGGDRFEIIAHTLGKIKITS